MLSIDDVVEGSAGVVPEPACERGLHLVGCNSKSTSGIVLPVVKAGATQPRSARE